MPRFENVETTDLIDMLSDETLRLTRLVRFQEAINPSNQYLRCKHKVEAILNELESRKAPHREGYLNTYELAVLSRSKYFLNPDSSETDFPRSLIA